MESEQDQKLFELLFTQMVVSLNEAAMMQMGKIVNPDAGKAGKNLAQARGTIDLLRMLQDKTKGNLNEREQNLLEQSVGNLQMNFVYEQDQSRKEKTESRESTASQEGGSAGGSEPEQQEEAKAADSDQDTDSDPEENAPGSGQSESDVFPPGNWPGQEN